MADRLTGKPNKQGLETSLYELALEKRSLERKEVWWMFLSLDVHSRSPIRLIQATPFDIRRRAGDATESNHKIDLLSPFRRHAKL